jgi:hypothetical protein
MKYQNQEEESYYNRDRAFEYKAVFWSGIGILFLLILSFIF